MSLFHIVILALVQGITEFLPISSSGHLVVTHAALGHNGAWENNLIIDAAVHVGTLFAALVYFRKDVATMGCAFVCRGQESAKGRMLLWAILAASIPVIIFGYIIHIFTPEWRESLHVMAWCTLIFAFVLWFADKYKPDRKTLSDLTIKDAVFIGMAQILALVPGTSRSGITISAARWLGFSRVEAARFSLLLAIVAISGAGLLSGMALMERSDIALTHNAFIAVFLAFLSGWLAIALMMRWLTRASFLPFVVYRIGLGVILLVLVYSGFI